ncbi:MAG: glycosyltransferase [Candidatus Ratteibacteria bacterium]|nr:glycosyltransferase [Candidatus Ratteibacteria bacterium]
MKTNVLRVVSNLGTGGVQKRLVSLIPYINREKFNISVCSFKDGPLKKTLIQAGYKVFIVRRIFKFDPICIIRLIKIIKAEKIHIIHTHAHKPNTTARIAAILAKVPIIIANEHNVDQWKSYFQKSIDRFLAKRTDKIIAVSNAVRQFYQSIGIPPEKFRLIYNGVELNKFGNKNIRKTKRKELGIDDQTCVIGTVGRIHPQKGHELLVKITEELLLEHKALLFLIIGKGYLEKKLTRKIKTLNLSEHFLFLGEREDIPELLSCMDIFALPSLREGFPNAIMEAMASSLPVVATDVGGIREIMIDNETGFIIPPADSRQLYEKLLKLIHDKDLRGKMGNAGHERVKQFSIEKMAKETEELYEELAKEKLPREIRRISGIKSSES